MARTVKNQEEILSKLKIEQLNPMQEEAQKAIQENSEVVLLSPTGTGKTLAFLLPLIAELDPDCDEVQLMILVPSRELALQIGQVTREMGSGYKTNTVYGGRTFSNDKIDLKQPPAILIGTPGRLADHLRRKTFSTAFIKTLVLDEYDKSLEVGFETEMKDITMALTTVRQKILTSATKGLDIPRFIGMKKPTYVDHLDQKITQLKIKAVHSPTKDKLVTLVKLLSHIGNQPGIIFCNFKDSIQRISDFLTDKNISHGCFYGGIEQNEREEALIKFRNGTHQLLIATDLAARGIDVPEIKFIIHYHLPPRNQEFIHRNGRTARMNTKGTAYILQWEEENLPDFIGNPYIEKLNKAPIPVASNWKTLFIGGGRRDKISKGDIAGLFMKQGKLKNNQLGIIEIKQDCAFVAVQADKVEKVIERVHNSKLKKKKVRVSVF